jgi:hypothetical protein
VKTSDTILLFIFLGIIALVGYGLVRTFMPTWVISASSYRCQAGEHDPDGTLVKICEYVKEHDIRSRTGDPTARSIAGTYDGVDADGREVTYVELDCCGDWGDTAVLDKATGEVVDYIRGNVTY